MIRNAKLLYIMGRSHSGTTVLDGLLGNGRDMINVGEFISNSYNTNTVCSCGFSFSNCQFWHEVRCVFEERLSCDWKPQADLVKNQAHIKRFIRTLVAGVDNPNIQEIKRASEAFFYAISKVSGKNLVVDSSKEVTYGLFLVRFMPYTKVIHIVRNPEDVAASHLFRIKKGQGYTILRHTFRSKRLPFFLLTLSSVGWVVGNLLAEFVRLYSPGHVIRLRYEDLCENPSQELEKISQFIEGNLEHPIKSIEQGKKMEVGHTIGGNGMRMARSFVFNPRAGSSKPPLPWYYKLTVWAICWPLMLLYGYHHSNGSHSNSRLTLGRVNSQH